MPFLTPTDCMAAIRSRGYRVFFSKFFFLLSILQVMPKIHSKSFFLWAWPRDYSVSYLHPETTFCVKQVHHQKTVAEELSDQSLKISHLTDPTVSSKFHETDLCMIFPPTYYIVDIPYIVIRNFDTS